MAMEEFATGVGGARLSRTPKFTSHLQSLFQLYNAYSAMALSSNFSEAFPKLVGLLEWKQDTKQFIATIYDHKSQEWLCRVEVRCFPHHDNACKNSIYGPL